MSTETEDEKKRKYIEEYKKEQTRRHSERVAAGIAKSIQNGG